MAATETTERRGNKKILIAALALVAAVALVGVGVFAAFNDTETTGVSTEAGALDITGADDITVDDVAPGDVAFRDLSIALPAANNDGNLVQSIRMQIPGGAGQLTDSTGVPRDAGDADTPTTLAGASLLRGSNGLRILIANCVGGTWTRPAANATIGSTAANGLYSSATCSGTVKVVQPEIRLADLIDTPKTYDAAAFGVAPTATGTIPDGSTLNLIAQLRLPTEAGNEYEDASLTFNLLFEAVQRAGVNR